MVYERFPLLSQERVGERDPVIPKYFTEPVA
jgi:hypothetical protein